MKPLIIFITLLILGINGFGQSIIYKSTRVHSGAGFVNESHTIKVGYSHSDDACDTIYIDKQPFFVLMNGNYGEEISAGSKKYKWSTLYLGVTDTKNGRALGPNSSDLNTKVYINHTGEIRTSPIESIYVFIHGLSATYYK